MDIFTETDDNGHMSTVNRIAFWVLVTHLNLGTLEADHDAHTATILQASATSCKLTQAPKAILHEFMPKPFSADWLIFFADF